MPSGFLEPLGERQADPRCLILAQCSKLAWENSTRGLGKSSATAQCDGNMLPKPPSLEVLLPPRLGMWSAGSFSSVCLSGWPLFQRVPPSSHPSLSND